MPLIVNDQQNKQCLLVLLSRRTLIQEGGLVHKTTLFMCQLCVCCVCVCVCVCCVVCTWMCVVWYVHGCVLCVVWYVHGCVLCGMYMDVCIVHACKVSLCAVIRCFMYIILS